MLSRKLVFLSLPAISGVCVLAALFLRGPTPPVIYLLVAAVFLNLVISGTASFKHYREQAERYRNMVRRHTEREAHLRQFADELRTRRR